MRRIIILMLLGVFALAPPALATGIFVYFNDGAIKNVDGTRTLSDGDYHNYKNKLEFFHNTLPAPNSSAGRLSDSFVRPNYTHVGGQHTYGLSTLSGGTLQVRVWEGAVAPSSAGNNYYGKTSHPIASGTTLPYDWVISNLRTEYKADVPYAPTVGTISESMVRVGDDLELTLTIPVNYNENGTDGKREITGRSLEIEFPDGSTDTRAGSSTTLRDTPAGTYRFTPIATNWYGSTRGTAVSYTTLGLGAAGPETITINFVKPSDDLGVNPFSFPFANLTDPAGLVNLKQLIEAVNSEAGANVVTVAGWWDHDRQQPTGYVISYNSETLNDFGSFYTAGEAPANPADVTLVKDRPYQISVLSAASIDLTGTR